MNIESLPVKIYKDSFIVKNTSKLLKESEIDSYIDNSAKDFLEDAYNERKSKIISSKYDEILEKDINSLIAKYIEKTHIFEGIDIKDRVIHLVDSSNNLIKTVIQTWFGKKPNTLVIMNKKLDKTV